MYRQLIINLVAASLLSACALTPLETRDMSTLQSIQDELASSQQPATQDALPPAQVSDALLPALPGVTVTTDSMEPRFDVLVDSVEARDFFMGLVKDTPYNMVVHPDVSGQISLELRGVTVDEVMSVVNEVYGYAYKKRGRLYKILPSGLQSEVFQIDYLSLKRRGLSETQVSAGQVTNAGSSSTNNNNSGTSNNIDNNNSNSNSRNSVGVVGTKIQTETESDFWGELKQTLTLLVGSGEGRAVVVTPQAGVVVVRAEPSELDVVRSYLRHAQLIMRRQVVLEAKILEVRLGDSYQSGVDWNAIATPGRNNTIGFGISGSSPVSPDGSGGIFGINLELGDFSGVIQMLETQGTVQVLSSPRISTINNQKAVIKVGQDEFFVTDISNTSTTSSGGIQNTPEVELTPFFSGIALDVTPQISEQEEIILHIHPSISEVVDQKKLIAIGDTIIELPLALSTIRETDSIVFARSGQVVILGGLMQSRSEDNNAGAPGLADIPLFGHLFTQQRNALVKSELIILLRPVIMGPDGLPEKIDDSARRFDQFSQELAPTYWGQPK